MPVYAVIQIVAGVLAYGGIGHRIYQGMPWARHFAAAGGDDPFAEAVLGLVVPIGGDSRVGLGQVPVSPARSEAHYEWVSKPRKRFP
jgi:hypothetical protein